MSPRFRPLASTVLLGLLLLLAGCGTMNAVTGFFGDQLSFTEPQLQKRLDRSFPREFDKLGGLVSATLSHPRLSLAGGDDRLRLGFDITSARSARATSPAGALPSPADCVTTRPPRACTWTTRNC